MFPVPLFPVPFLVSMFPCSPFPARMALPRTVCLSAIVNETLRLCVEYQGQQHYVFPNAFHKSRDEFVAQPKRDQLKKALCQAAGGTLVEVPYTVKRRDMQAPPRLLSLVCVSNTLPAVTAVVHVPALPPSSPTANSVPHEFVLFSVCHQSLPSSPSCSSPTSSLVARRWRAARCTVTAALRSMFCRVVACHSNEQGVGNCSF